MRIVKDINNKIIEVGDIIIFAANSNLRRAKVLKICENSLKISCYRDGSGWIEYWNIKAWNYENHNSHQYKYLWGHYVLIQEKGTKVIETNNYEKKSDIHKVQYPIIEEF